MQHSFQRRVSSQLRRVDAQPYTFLPAVNIWFIAGRDRGVFGFLVAVQLADVKRIHAHLCCEHVDGDFRTHEGLWRTVAAERRAPRMVGEYRLALIANRRNVVTGTSELAETVRQQVTKFGI